MSRFANCLWQVMPWIHDIQLSGYFIKEPRGNGHRFSIGQYNCIQPFYATFVTETFHRKGKKNG